MAPVVGTDHSFCQRAHELQPADQPPHHLFIAIPEDGHGHHEIDHDMRRQQAGPFLPAAGLRQYLIHHVFTNQAGEYPDPYPVGQPAADCNLAAHGTEDSIWETK